MTEESELNNAADDATGPTGETSVEHNKAVSRRWIDVFNARDNTAETDVRAPDYGGSEGDRR